MNVVSSNEKVKMNTKELSLTGMMISIIIIMSLTPLGYFRSFGISISLLPIPVAIGAIVLGKKVGLILGIAFGLTSFHQALTGNPFSSVLLSINPIYTFILSVGSRALMGFCVGLIFEKIENKFKNNSIPYFVCGLLAAMLNTLFYMSTLILLFWNTEFLQTFNEGFGGLNPVLFVFAFVGVNGALEMPASCLIGGYISRILKKVI